MADLFVNILKRFDPADDVPEPAEFAQQVALNHGMYFDRCEVRLQQDSRGTVLTTVGIKADSVEEVEHELHHQPMTPGDCKQLGT